MIPDDMKEKIDLGVAILVATRLATGDDEKAIRCETAAAAAKVIARNFPDQWEQETYMAEINQAIDRTLGGKRRGRKVKVVLLESPDDGGAQDERRDAEDK